MTARILSELDHAKGYVTCDDCGVYAYVFSVKALGHLPKGYSGEICEQCECLMVPVNLLTHKKESA